MDGGAWWATIHGVTKSQTRLSDFTLTSLSGGSVVKNPPAGAEDARDVSSIPGLGGSPGEGNGNPLQYSSGKSHGQRSLAGYVQSMGSQRIGHN